MILLTEYQDFSIIVKDKDPTEKLRVTMEYIDSGVGEYPITQFLFFNGVIN